MTQYLDTWNRKLRNASSAHQAGRTVWFRRDSYTDTEFTEIVPKWHVFKDRTQRPESPEGTYTWKALCGYSYYFQEYLLRTPNLRIGNSPKKAEQCISCSNRLHKKEAEAGLLAAQHVTTKVEAMSEQPVFTGTPDDWWEQAEEIMESEAANRTLGSWYITQIRTAGNTRPGYRLSTPSKPANTDNLIKARGPHDSVSLRVRRLITGEADTPSWVTSLMVVADTVVGDETQRLPWIRKNNGRWQSLYDGRININDHAMAELNPNSATITEDLI